MTDETQEQEKAPERRGEASELSAVLVRILNDVIASQAKAHDAPASSDLHMASAVTRLLEITPEWEPWDEESAAIAEEAKETMRLLGHAY